MSDSMAFGLFALSVLIIYTVVKLQYWFFYDMCPYCRTRNWSILLNKCDYCHARGTK